MRLRQIVFMVGIVLFLLSGIVTPMAALQAQSSTIVLSVAVPQYLKDVFTAKLISDFETATPGVSLNIVDSDSANSGDIPPAWIDLDKHLEAIEKYVSSADVVLVRDQMMSTAATRAGDYLDLTPLVSSDAALDADDFYPAALQSFQWDKGTWALPVSMDTWIFTYDPDAFDKAGLSYPDEKWTVDDLANAIRKLSEKDADGKVTKAALGLYPGYNDAALFRSLIGEPLFDPNTVPNTPKLNTPAVEAFAKTWGELRHEGFLTPPNGNIDGLPMSVTNIFALQFQPDPTQKRAGSLLPGGKSAIQAQGFAVSAGTQHPEQAYALARFLTSRPELSNRLGNLTARKSLKGVQPDDGAFRPTLKPEVQALLDQTLASALPASELHYTEYLSQALDKMESDKIDAATALENAEAQAIKDQKTAAAKKQNNVVAVATPVPTPILQAGQVSLKFSMVSFMSPLPNKDKWDSLIKDFTSSDPQVKAVILDSGFSNGSLEKTADQYDCFYLPYNAVPGADVSPLLNLDPYLAADQSFDKADVVGNTLNQLTKDNKIWGMPLMISPAILKYNSDLFSSAGVSIPDNDWTVDKFKDTLKALKTDPKADPPFVTYGPSGTHLLILIAAYGGLPLDYRTDPPMINYTDPATVTAIRQVLDLAKQGYIKYEKLGSLVNGGGGGGGSNVPILPDTLGGFGFFGNRSNGDKDPYKPVNYPRGTTYSALSYGIGTAYISAKTPNPDACYRWISLLAKHPELFSAMPARRSLINDPALAAAQGTEIVALYNQIDTLLKDPNTISVPDQFAGGTAPTGYLLQHWLYEAFDDYVLNNGDLDAQLKTANDYANNFQACATTLPPYDASTPEKMKTYIKAFGDCATKTDSRLASLFSSIQ
ncbi:MAG: hypothetical protein ABI947_01270 [Chloroflexota bacterium]